VNAKNVVLNARVLASTLSDLTNLVDAGVDRPDSRYKNAESMGLRFWQNVCSNGALFGNRGGCNENILDRISDRHCVPGELLCVQHAARLVNTRGQEALTDSRSDF
jgi:hypothetical protein